MYRLLILLVVLALGFATLAGASEPQEGKLMIVVKPHQAYIFVDGKPFGGGSQMIRLPAGSHTIAAYNYGYTPQSRDVSVQAGNNAKIEFKLERVTEANVMGPRGRIQIEGASRAAVFLNGKKPGYFVGHGDEFNNNFVAWQQLIVPPGTYQLTVTDKNKEIWSGPVTVAENQRVIVDVSKGGQQKVKRWSEGEDLKAFPRFKTDFFANTVVAVAPVTGEFKAEQTKLNCGETTRLVWSSRETVDAHIADGSEQAKDLPPSGDLTARPLKTTTYAFRAVGPGGVVESNTTVDVNTAVQATLEASPAQIPYRKIGDKVLMQGSSTLNWNTSNSDAITLDPGGVVTATGTQTVQPVPKQTSTGPVDETVTYTLVAKNECGGEKTQTATVHLVGSIGPVPNDKFSSVFFPTGYPTLRHPGVGLVGSQQMSLSQAAMAFKAYLEYDPDARIEIAGYADERGSKTRNLALSQRRVARVQQFLVTAGIPSDKIGVTAHGEDQPLTVAVVKSREQENPNKGAIRNWQVRTWAYNRRVDLTLIPKGAEQVPSVRFFPHQASDASLLHNPAWPSVRAVQKAGGNGALETTTSLTGAPTGRP